MLQLLDGFRPIIHARPRSPAEQRAAVALYAQLRRIFPSCELDGIAIPGEVAEVGSKSTCVPTRDFHLVIGATRSSGDLFIGGNDWTAVVSRTAVVLDIRTFDIGVQAATAFAAAEVFKHATQSALVGGHLLLTNELVWNAIDYRLEQVHATIPPDKPSPLNLVLAGAGSVGSSAAWVLSGNRGINGGRILVVDPESFSESNRFRYPAIEGNATGSKATWCERVLRGQGWDATAVQSGIGDWCRKCTNPGFDGVVLSSVDTLQGRFDVADILARQTVSAGVAGLALHVQREILGDGLACPYCDYVNAKPPLSEAEAYAKMFGLRVERVVQLLLGDSLTTVDVESAWHSGAVERGFAQSLIGCRFADLIKRAYAEAAIRDPVDSVDVLVAAPFVSWMAGVLLAGEYLKLSAGLAPSVRRVDLDLSGVPPGFGYSKAAVTAGCACTSPIRLRWMKRLWG